MPHRIRICVALSDAPLLEQAVSLALTTWTEQLRNGNSTLWEQYAVTAHVIRNGLSKIPEDARCWFIALREDTAEVLHGVARTCEAHESPATRIAPVVRRYADQAAAREPQCEFAPPIINSVRP